MRAVTYRGRDLVGAGEHPGSPQGSLAAGRQQNTDKNQTKRAC